MLIITAKKEQHLSIEEATNIIYEIKDALKESEIAQEVCKEHGFEPDIIDAIVIRFDDIKVSAETINGEMTLNNELVNDGFHMMMRYAIHELVHIFQHMNREGKSDPYQGQDYLDRPDEQEAFKVQIEYEKQENGEAEAEEYVDGLLDYHNIPENKREDIKKELDA